MLHDMCAHLRLSEIVNILFIIFLKFRSICDQTESEKVGDIKKKHFKNQSYAPAHGSISATLGVCSPWRLQRKVPSSILGRPRDHEQVEFGFAALDGPKALAGGVIHHISLATSPHGTAI